MISITISGTERVLSALEKMQKINNLVVQWMKSGNPDAIMQKSIEKNFASEGRPKWQALAGETLEDRANKGFSPGPVLTRTGNLRDELTSLRGKVTSNFNSAMMSWGIDQLRGEEKLKFGVHQSGKGKSGQFIPARPMLGFQPEDGKKLVKDLRDWILKSFV
jgi:phage gpG-like protein